MTSRRKWGVWWGSPILASHTAKRSMSCWTNWPKWWVFVLFMQIVLLLCIFCNFLNSIFRTAVNYPSGPVEAVTSRSKHLSYMLALIPQETSFSWRYFILLYMLYIFKVTNGPCGSQLTNWNLTSAVVYVSGMWWLHSPAQQHRHGLWALVVREAHQHDLLPQDQGSVSLETQRPRNPAQ